MSSIDALQNNTNPVWYRDKGLRRMAVHIGVLYLCVFTFGYDGALLNGLQAVPRWQQDLDRPTGHVLGLIAAVFYIPKIITPWIGSWIADRYGRRWTLMLGSLFIVAGAIVNALAPNRGVYIAGRTILGGALAFHGVIAPPMIQEICHPRMRAVTGGMLLSMFYVGSTTAAWLCFGMVGWNDSWAWRMPTLLQCFGSTVIGIYVACGLMVESPRWLVKVGRETEAHKVLADLHANGDLDDELVKFELAEIKMSIQAEKLRPTGYLTFVKVKANRRRLFILMTIAASGQLNGTGLITYYIAPILRLIGVTQPLQVAGINGGLAIWGGLTIIFAAQFVERLGRRPLWLIASCGILVCFTFITAFSGSFATTRNASVGTAVIPFLFLFTLCYNCGWATLANLYVAEMLPTALRAKGMSIYVTTQAVSIAFNQYVNPVALEAIAWKYYLCYIALQILLIAFTYFFCIETKGRTMEEVARLFDDLDGKGSEDLATRAAERIEPQTEKEELEHHEHGRELPVK